MEHDLTLLCDLGCERFLAEEVERLIGKRGEASEGYVLVRGVSTEEIGRLHYQSQLASRILLLIDEGEGGEWATAEEKLSTFDYSSLHATTFRVTCERHPESCTRQEVEEHLGRSVNLDVNLSSPDITIWSQITGRYVVGIDLSGRDLGKREYRAFHTRRSLRATIAAAALYAGGVNGHVSLLDPFSADGLLAIEAALMITGKSPQRYSRNFSFTRFFEGDWKALFDAIDAESSKECGVSAFSPTLRLVQIGRSNAKLAGVDKLIAMTRCDTAWLSEKFGSELDFIVTQPPCSGKSTPLKSVEPLQEALFKEATRILKPTGKMLIISEKRAEFLNPAERYGFKLEKEFEVWMGRTRITLLRLAR